MLSPGWPRLFRFSRGRAQGCNLSQQPCRHGVIATTIMEALRGVDQVFCRRKL
jgi:hypothetical protein